MRLFVWLWKGNFIFLHGVTGLSTKQRCWEMPPRRYLNSSSDTDLTLQIQVWSWRDLLTGCSCWVGWGKTPSWDRWRAETLSPSFPWQQMRCGVLGRVKPQVQMSARKQHGTEFLYSNQASEMWRISTLKKDPEYSLKESLTMASMWIKTMSGDRQQLLSQIILSF